MLNNKFKSFLMISLIVILITPGQLKADEVMVNLYPEKANLWYFHCPEKGFNFYFLNVWPNNYLLTKFAPPTFKISESLSFQIAVGPDLALKADKFSDLFESFTADIMPIFSKGDFFVFLVNEFGINKDGKFIHFLRHTATYKDIGVRFMTCGTFGEKVNYLFLGPVFKAGKLQLWVAKDFQNEKWQIEFTFNIKL